MPPINQRERSQAFYNFLLFFIITIGVIVTALLFSFQVPFKDNDRLRKKMDAVENEKLFIDQFEARLQETMNQLDSVNLAPNPYRYDNQISNNIRAMTDLINESGSVKNIFSKIIDNLQTLQAAKKELRDINRNSGELEKKDREIERLQGQLETCKDRIIQLQTSR